MKSFNTFILRHWKTVLSVGFGVLFLWAGIVKLVFSEEFEFSLRSFGMERDVGVYILANTLPYFEIIVGIGLMLPRIQRQSMFAVFVALIVFIGALVFAMAGGNDVNCGCFGPGKIGGDPVMALVRDVIMLGIAGMIYWKKFDQEDAQAEPIQSGY